MSNIATQTIFKDDLNGLSVVVLEVVLTPLIVEIKHLLEYAFKYFLKSIFSEGCLKKTVLVNLRLRTYIV